jgi:hypothetical protein
LDQYFKGNNFKVIEIVEENWDAVNPELPKYAFSASPRFEQTKTNFRIKRMSATKRTANQSKVDNSPAQEMRKRPSQKHLAPET